MKKSGDCTEFMYRKPRICFLDIEATNLNADFGFILCVSWKWQGEKKVYTTKISDSKTFQRDVTNDKYVVQEAATELGKADIWVGWYSSRFDIPYINTRLLHHCLPVLPPIAHVDAWRIARYKMKLHSNRMASISSFFGLEEKTPLKGDIWVKATSGHKKSIDYVVRHCEQDVLVLEQAYDRIKPLCTNHPNIVLFNKTDKPMCPTCGSLKVEARGYYPRQSNLYRHYYCRSCGRWARKRTAEKTTKPILV